MKKIILILFLLIVATALSGYTLLDKINKKYSNNQAEVNANQDYVAPENVNQQALGSVANISVDWLNQPILIDAQSFFGSDFLQREYNVNYPDQRIGFADWLKTIKIYQVGMVSTAGEYLNKDLFVVSYNAGYWDGPSGFYIDRIIKNGDELVYLTNDQNQNFTPETFKTKQFANINITNLETVPTIAIPQTNLTLIKSNAEAQRIFSDYTHLKEQFKSGNQAVYQDLDTNCFLVKAADSTAREYYLNLPFLGAAGQSTQYAGLVPNILDFYWLNGSQNVNEYLSAGYASVSHPCYGYADYVTNFSLLNKVGQNNNGDIFYELKQDIAAVNNRGEYFVLQSMYDQYYPGYDGAAQNEKTKITFADFVKAHPIIFWQDPFGRFVEFKNAKYLPAAEMGKPVIYLYPEKTTDVTVEVMPTGGFTKTEPAYSNGWKVSAKPSGELYNYADRKTYPYLFWEGIGLNYERPQEGFVVKKGDLKIFLEDKLVKSGLIKNEYDEFIAFWLPKMQADPYYFITFVPQEQFNLLAPLKISPQPNTVIRVFMDYQGLAKPITVQTQIIVTPIRKGFTVVEWGGQLRH